jgi:hypothetical protein
VRAQRGRTTRRQIEGADNVARKRCEARVSGCARARIMAVGMRRADVGSGRATHEKKIWRTRKKASGDAR